MAKTYPTGIMTITPAASIAAGKYIRAIRSPRKLRYAQRYLTHLKIGEGEPPETEGLSFMAAQAVRLRLWAIIQGYQHA